LFLWRKSHNPIESSNRDSMHATASQLQPAMARVETHDSLLEPGAEPAVLPAEVSREYLLHNRICPLVVDRDGAVEVAVEPDSVLQSLDDLGVLYGAPVVPVQRDPAEIPLLIERLVARTSRDVRLRDAGLLPDEMEADVRNLANQPPVIRYVNLLIRDGHEAGASDIHLDAGPTGITARYRIDGVLTRAMDPAPELERATVSRVKLLAELDIAERRRPQDGRLRIRLDHRELDIRVSSVPTVYGESVVMRLLERSASRAELTGLGLSTDMLAALSDVASKPHGILLVTGPTGSGKTTTLYALLGLRPAEQEKIITLEDPVEHPLPSITQIPVLPQAGIHFANMLRSVLRQDPDVIMVGEMRDEETAQVAVQAALTGHLVLSTLHTNDALAAIVRLVDLGVPRFLISAALVGVLGQRLVRLTCPACRNTPSPAEPCRVCHGTGFRGRTGIFELLIPSPALRDAIASGADRAVLESLAKDSGWVPMVHDGLAKVEAGATDVREVLRVTA
jgi:general secretion pathway protein E